MTRPRPTGLDALFRPRSVAVVGTSSRPRTIGREILANLLRDGFNGVVTPVNPRHEHVNSLRCYKDVLEVPGDVDLVVACIPAKDVPDLARQCAQKGVGGLVVISAGFREVGGEGEALERELADITRAAGIRVIGPNCMGIINTDDDVRLNASFAAAQPVPGRAAFVSQSGALGEAILGMAQGLGVGISRFVSAGNRVDVSTADLLEYWEDDPHVGSILLYLESVGGPRRFPDIARRVSRKKPIIAVKGGRTVAGASAARSHTGALAGHDVAIDTLLAQCGVLRVASIEDMFATASLLATQPLARGPRVGIVANAGGPAILATDACATLGLEMATLSESTRARLAAILPPEASLRNPVDMVAQAVPEQFHGAIAAVLDDEGVDSLIVIFITPVYIDSLAIAQAIRSAVDGATKPVLACFMGKERHVEAVAELRAAGIPVHAFPEAPARALREMERRRAWLARDQGVVPELDVDAAAARAVVARVRASGREELSFEEARAVAIAYGFPFVATRVAQTLEEVVDAAGAIGLPVVLKAEASGLSHKTDRGGVAVDLRTIDEIVKAHRSMRLGLGSDFPDLAFLVQGMAKGDREVILGMRHDPDFGPLLMFGLGGIHVEVLGDVVFRVHPITDTDALDMVRGLRGHALLTGVRGAKPVPEEALVDLLLRLSRLVTDLPEVQELDLNPVMVGDTADRFAAVDARMRLFPSIPN